MPSSSFAAQRFFIISERRFRATGLMGLRLGADFPVPAAHRFFMASEMRLRAAALIRRRLSPDAGPDCFALGGRPRRGEADELRPSSAEMAWSIRLRSALSSETKI